MSHLVQGNYQYNLFENITEQVSLYRAMDRIRNRYGLEAVTRAATIGLHYAPHEVNAFIGKGTLNKATHVS